MSINIQTTKNYDLFELCAFNRDVTKTKTLESSMVEHGWIEAYPMHVIKEKGKLKIKAGHHRFTVAQKLGIPVIYVVCNDTASIHQLEDAGPGKWSLSDYLNSFVRIGKVDYIVIKEFTERTGISLSLCISMFAGECTSGSNFNTRFKAGTFAISENAYAEKVADIINILKHCGVAFAGDRSMVVAISRIVKAGHADLKRLKNKIASHTHMIEKCANVDQYMDILEAVYNRNIKGAKTPLAMQTNQTIKETAAVVK
jgi:hypothetical protein